MLQVARTWAKERVQWGQPVGKHDAVAQKIAFIAATSFGLEAMLDVSSRLADDKKHDIRIEAALAKLIASEGGGRVVDRSMQIHGGMGMTKDLPLERWYRENRAWWEPLKNRVVTAE